MVMIKLKKNNERLTRCIIHTLQDTAHTQAVILLLSNSPIKRTFSETWPFFFIQFYKSAVFSGL